MGCGGATWNFNRRSKWTSSELNHNLNLESRTFEIVDSQPEAYADEKSLENWNESFTKELEYSWVKSHLYFKTKENDRILVHIKYRI